MCDSELDDMLSVFSDTDMLPSDEEVCTPPSARSDQTRALIGGTNEDQLLCFDNWGVAPTPVATLDARDRAALLAEADALPTKLPSLDELSMQHKSSTGGRISLAPVLLSPVVARADSRSGHERPKRRVRRTARSYYVRDDNGSDSDVDGCHGQAGVIRGAESQMTAHAESKGKQAISEAQNRPVKRRTALPDDGDPSYEPKSGSSPQLFSGRRTEKSTTHCRPPAHARLLAGEQAVICRLLPIDVKGEADKESKRLAIMRALENLALAILDCLPESTTNPTQSELAVRPIAVAMESRYSEDSSLQSQSLSNAANTTCARWIVFPRICGDLDTPRFGAKELACLMRVAEFIHDGLRTNTISTLRDLYYRDTPLFGKQQVVDAFVDDVAASLHVRRNDLNITAASKGLFGGVLRIHTVHGNVLSGDKQGALIPPIQSIAKLEADCAEWVLVIEKEAVFQTLCSGNFCDRADLSRGVILTGKGYPDVSTRELLKRLSDEFPSVPLLCLVDADPHGLEILSTYRQGSSSRAFDRRHLATPRLQWLGVKGTEWDELDIERDELIPLTSHDRKKAASMLKRSQLPADCSRELEYMLHVGRKAEIQILSSCNGVAPSASQANAGDSRLVSYLAQKIEMACVDAQRGIGM